MDISNLVKCISSPRLEYYNKYLSCATDVEKIGAYVAYQDLSCDFYSLLQMVEVALRNAINEVATKKFKSTSWYDDVPVSEKSKSIVRYAKEKAIDECGAKEYTDDDVICRLTFGFWVYMLDAPYRDTSNAKSYLWDNDSKNEAFPNAVHVFSGKKRRTRDIFQSFQKVLELRNRLFHHEPIWKRAGCGSHEMAVKNMNENFDFLVSSLGSISSEKAELFKVLGYFDRFHNRCEVGYVTSVIDEVQKKCNPSHDDGS